MSPSFRRFSRAAFATLAISLAAETPAIAAGFGLKEHSADAMAAAYAGSAATDKDASYLAYNPASLAGVTGTDFSFDTVEILPGSRGDYTSASTFVGTSTGGGTKPSGFISDAFVPAFAVRHRLTDRIAVGLEIDAPWGLKTDYPRNWAGRYYAQKTQLLTIDATPSIAYQLTPGVAVGAGLQVEFAQATLTTILDTGSLGAFLGVPGATPGAQDTFSTVRGKSWAIGYTAGVMATPEPGLTLGLSYHSSMQHDLKGTWGFALDKSGVAAAIRNSTGFFTDTPQTTPLTMPDMIEFGARDDISDKWTGMLEFDWTDWSRFREARIEAANPRQPDDVTTLRWRNAFFGSLGAEYRAYPDWTFRTGVAYDQSPVPDATREPRLPDADRIWLSAGVRWRMNDALDVNVTASRVFLMKSDIALDPSTPGAVLRGSLTGKTESYVNVVGLEFSYRPD